MFGQQPRFLNVIFSLAVALMLSSCASNEENYTDMPVELLYNKAMDLLEAGSFQKAASTFDEVDRQHPYSKWATKAQIMAAYANYRGQKYERALASLESFLQLHPAHEDVPYALYLQGLCYYEQLSPAARDQKDTAMALEIFQDLHRRFSQSDYGRDARLKIQLLEDALAGKEMDIARYYQRKKSYGAAINRFKNVVSKYQTTKHVEEALHRLVECYMALGLKEEAQGVAAVLGHNYSSSPWYEESYYLIEGKSSRKKPTTLRSREEGWFDQIRNWTTSKENKVEDLEKKPK